MKWEKIRTFNITTASGEPDTIHLEYSRSNGGYRIINDYGNESITFDTMTGLEAITKLLNEITTHINSRIIPDNLDFNGCCIDKDIQFNTDCEGL